MQFLVITGDCYEVDWSSEQEILAEEAKAVWGYLLSDKLRSIWLTEDSNDAILLFEADNKNDVISIMKTLPLVKSKMISYKVIGLTPYSGLERLFCGTNKQN